MKEEEKEEKKKKEKYILIDDIPHWELEGPVVRKNSKQQGPVKNPFTFGWLQENKERQFMPDIIDELQKILKIPFIPGEWKIYEIKNGEIKELKDEDEENDNSK